MNLSDTDSLGEPETLFLQLKAFNSEKHKFGGLVVLPKSIVEFVAALESIFVQNFEKLAAQPFVGYKLKSQFLQVPFM